VQLYHYFVSQFSEFCHHNPLCCFSSVCCCCCCLFHYWLSLETFGYLPPQSIIMIIMESACKSAPSFCLKTETNYSVKFIYICVHFKGDNRKKMENIPVTFSN